MKRKDQFLLHLLPMTLAAALAATPVLAQSAGSAGGASGNTAATGTDTRSSTTHSATGTTTTGTTTTGTTTATTVPATTGSTAVPMANWPADSVIMHRPRLSQLIGTNVYNDRNETIGEVDDVILATPAGTSSRTGSTTTTTTTGAAGTTTSGTSSAAPSGTTTGSTTTGATTPGGTAGTVAATGTTGTMQGPMAIIQVGGFLGIGGRLVAVPLSELQWNSERERIIMPNASKETLQGRPAFSYDTLRRG